MVACMSNIKENLQNQYWKIKVETFYDIYKVSIIFIFLISFPANFFSDIYWQYKIIRLLIITVITVVTFAVLQYFNKYNLDNKKRMLLYQIIAIFYTIILASTSPHKYLTTNGIFVLLFTFIIFLSLSKTMLFIQGGLTLFLIIVSTVPGPGNQVSLGWGYVSGSIGVYCLLFYTMFRGVQMFEQFEIVYLQNLNELRNTNLELSAMNQQYYAAAEELKKQYDEIQDLSVQIRDQNLFLSSIIKATEDGFIIFNITKGTVELYNQIQILLGKEKIELNNDIPNFIDSIQNTSQTEFLKLWKNIYLGSKSNAQIDIQYCRKENNLDLRVTMLYLLNERHDVLILLSVKNITKEKESEREIKFWSEHDPLTECLNRFGFEQRISFLLNTKKDAFYLVIFEVSDYMYINNSFGYQIGNMIMKEIINQITQNICDISNIGRIKDDTGIFIVDKVVEKEEILGKLDRILNNITIQDIHLRIPVSIGFADAKEEYSAIDLIRNAEMAINKVKTTKHGNYAIHDEQYIQKMDRRFRIVQLISKAINQEEFYLMYQPKVCITTGKLIGFEALVRWESTEIGAIYPSEFIEISEQTGQIISLGHYIMKKAMEFAKEIAKIDDSLIVSINLSPKQLIENDFLDQLKAILLLTGVSTKNIAFEITETAYIENMDQCKRVLEYLNTIQIQIYLDDFGTGYSSLSYLHQLPIHVLKIDKYFIDLLTESIESRELLEAILIMARRLNLKTIAEGVETKEQFVILKELQCDLIQGYYFDKPLNYSIAIDQVGKVYNI